jgi:hypothetical protein
VFFLISAPLSSWDYRHELLAPNTIFILKQYKFSNSIEL